MSTTKKIAAFIGLVTALVLCVAPLASAHTGGLVASLDCNGNVSWTFSSNGFDAHFTISDSTLGQQGGTMTLTGPDYSTSGSYSVPTSMTSATVTATVTWDDGYTENTSVTADYSRSSDCQTAPAISTDASGPVTVGSQINDVATLSGAVGATGAVTFQVFAPGDTTCANPVATLATSGKDVDGNGNGTYTSAGYTTTTVGTYRWRAFFAGDGNNAAVSGACNAEGESSTVTQATPAIATKASGPFALGCAIIEVATLSGAVGATGAVTFQVFAPGDTTCATPLATLSTESKTVDGNGNGTYTSAGFTTTTAGTYRWRAFFAGDSNNAAVSGACNAVGESSNTAQVTPAITTQASGPVAVGGTINDVATLSGAVGATGAVTFQVFAPADTSCATPLATLATTTKNVDGNGNGTYTSAGFTTTTAGTYQWRAFFAGDTNNAAVSGACNAPNEGSTVTTPSSPPPSTPGSPSIAITKRPEVAVARDRRHRELHHHRHEHGQRDPDERHRQRRPLAQLQRVQLDDRGTRFDGAGRVRDLQLLPGQRVGVVHEQRDGDRDASVGIQRHRDRHRAGDRSPADAAGHAGAEADAHSSVDRDRQGSVLADGGGRRHRDVQDHRHEHR